FLILSAASGQVAPLAPKSVTVPVTLDHNRIIIDVRFPLADGTQKRVRAWLDNGDPEMSISGDLAKTLGLQLSSEPQGNLPAKEQTASVPSSFVVGGMVLRAPGLKQAHVAVDREYIARGMSAAVNLPSSL